MLGAQGPNAPHQINVPGTTQATNPHQFNTFEIYGFNPGCFTDETYRVVTRGALSTPSVVYSCQVVALVLCLCIVDFLYFPFP